MLDAATYVTALHIQPVVVDRLIVQLGHTDDFIYALMTFHPVKDLHVLDWPAVVGSVLFQAGLVAERIVNIAQHLSAIGNLH